ncbi:MAG TPA: hypothetical protein VHU41_18830, partial [Thermoanaerobaculia bacterium]|nr:hypothetical protein [Thermoanaerobaculia bacterium]
MHRPVAVATFIVCLVTPLFSALYAQSCPPPTQPAITLQNAEICANATDRAWTASGAASYSWTATKGSIVWSDSSGNVTFLSDGTGDVVLGVTVTDSNGCPATNSVTVPLHTIAPPVIRTIYTDSMCTTGWNWVSVDEPSGAAWSSIAWTVQNATILGPAESQYLNFQGDGSGNPPVVSVTVVDENMCSASSSITIPLRTLDPPAISVYGGDDPLCPNVQGAAQIPSNGPDNQPWASIQWTIEHGTFNGAANQAYAGFLADGSGETIVLHVTVTANDGCQATATASKPSRVIAAPAIHVQNSPMCINSYNMATVDPMPNGQSWGWINWTIQYGTINSGMNSSTVYFTSDGSGQPVVLSAYVAEPYTNCNATATTTIPIGTIPPP